MSDKLRNGVQAGRYRAEFEDGTVVFMIGMRFNSLWRITHWLPAFLAMPKMLRELSMHPELGLLGYQTWMRWRQVMVVQYWKDMEHLMRYATARDNEHLPAWSAFNRRTQQSPSVGIWHEAYEVHPQTSHTVYRDMPSLGMSRAAGRRDVAALPTQPVKRRGKGPGDTEYDAME